MSNNRSFPTRQNTVLIYDLCFEHKARCVGACGITKMCVLVSGVTAVSSAPPVILPSLSLSSFRYFTFYMAFQRMVQPEFARIWDKQNPGYTGDSGEL